MPSATRFGGEKMTEKQNAWQPCHLSLVMRFLMHHFPSPSASTHHNQPLFSRASHYFGFCIFILRMWSSGSVYDLSNHCFSRMDESTLKWSALASTGNGLTAPEIRNSDSNQPRTIDQQNDSTWLCGNWAEYETHCFHCLHPWHFLDLIAQPPPMTIVCWHFVGMGRKREMNRKSNGRSQIISVDLCRHWKASSLRSWGSARGHRVHGGTSSALPAPCFFVPEGSQRNISPSLPLFVATIYASIQCRWSDSALSFQIFIREFLFDGIQLHRKSTLHGKSCEISNPSTCIDFLLAIPY
jgi:hypothetical protein